MSLAIDPNGERRIMGVAIDLDYLDKHYAYYTLVNSSISHFPASSNVAVPGSEMTVLRLAADGYQLPKKSGTIDLRAGLHALAVTFFERRCY